MELLTDELISELWKKHPSFNEGEIVALVQAEAILRIAELGLNVYLNNCDAIPVDLRECRQ